MTNIYIYMHVISYDMTFIDGITAPKIKNPTNFGILLVFAVFVIYIYVNHYKYIWCIYIHICNFVRVVFSSIIYTVYLHIRYTLSIWYNHIIVSHDVKDSIQDWILGMNIESPYHLCIERRVENWSSSVSPKGIMHIGLTIGVRMSLKRTT